MKSLTELITNLDATINADDYKWVREQIENAMMAAFELGKKTSAEEILRQLQITIENEDY